MSAYSPPLAALDVGNQRVLALIGEPNQEGSVVIRGVGVARSQGMQAGQVKELRPVAKAICAALEEAELMANLKVDRVYAGIAGSFVAGRTTRAEIILGPREREVTERDLDALHEAVRRQSLPQGQTVLNVVAPTYSLDDQRGLLNPLGMMGRHLAIDAYVLVAQESIVQSLEKAINEAGVPVEEMVFSPVAASLVTLTPEERRLGSIFIDIGYGMTTYAAFAGNKLLVAGCLEIGANKVNDDLVHRFQTTTEGAEKAKREAGTVLLADVGEDETLSLPTIDRRGSHIVSRLDFCKTMRARLQETFGLVANRIWSQVPPPIPFIGVVLVGGGSHLEGIAALAEEVFVKRVRLGDMEGVVDATHLLQTPDLPARSPAVALGLLAHAHAVTSGKGCITVPKPKPSNSLFAWIKHKFMTKKGGGS